jgi:hypothetical protein
MLAWTEITQRQYTLRLPIPESGQCVGAVTKATCPLFPALTHTCVPFIHI